MLDPSVLEAVLPGVEAFEETAPFEFAATLNIGVPAVKGRYKGTVSILDIVEHQSYRLVGKGMGQQGWARGEGALEMSEAAGKTTVRIAADIQIGGKLAGIGQRMIEGVSKMLADEFFASLEGQLQGRQVQKATPIMFFLKALMRWFRTFLSGLFASSGETGGAK